MSRRIHFDHGCAYSNPVLSYPRTADPGEVTCRLCLAVIGERPEPFEPSGPYQPRQGAREPVVVEREQARPPWLNEAHALRALCHALDNGYRQKSVSDPARFEPTGSGGSAHPRGDLGQREVEHLDAVTRALRASFTAPWVVCDTPRREIHPDTCRAILMWRVVGEAVRRQPMASRFAKSQNPDRVDYWRKQTYVDRVDFTAVSISRRLTAAHGFTISPGEVERIARAGRYAVRTYLRERDLIPVLVRTGMKKGNTEEHNDMGETIDREADLEGWDEIADVVGCRPRTARAYANRNDDPLPVYAAFGRVVAIRDEVKAWKLRQYKPRKTGS